MTADGWIEHDGKGMPVDGEKRVRLRFRSGYESRVPRPAIEFHWGNGGVNVITHYRIVAGPAPTATEPVMTLRDQFAMAAMTGILANEGWSSGLPTVSYSIADAMMAERSKK